MAEKRKRADGLWEPVLDRVRQVKIERDIVSVLQKVAIFEELSRRDIHNIARIAHHRHYGEGEVIIHQDQASAGMYIIVEGEVEVTKEWEDGTIVHLSTLEDATFFGDVGLLDNAPRTATVTAVRDSKIVGFFRPELLGLLDSDPKLAFKVVFKLAELLASRLRFTNNELEKAQQDIDRLKAAQDCPTQTDTQTLI